LLFESLEVFRTDDPRKPGATVKAASGELKT